MYSNIFKLYLIKKNISLLNHYLKYFYYILTCIVTLLMYICQLIFCVFFSFTLIRGDFECLFDAFYLGGSIFFNISLIGL